MKSDTELAIKRIMGKYYLEDPFKLKILNSLYYSFWKYYYKFIGIPYKIKYFVQRHTRGYDDLDKWNASWYIARKAAPVLRAMKQKLHGTAIKRHIENRHGIIIELSEEEIYANSNEKDWQGPAAFTEEEWNSILDDIIFAFQFHIDFDTVDGTISEEDAKKGFKRQKRGLQLFAIYFNSLWD